MDEDQTHEAEWEGLRLVVQESSDHFQAFVYDPTECEVLYTASRMNLDAAKIAAVEYAAAARFGQGHNLKPTVISAMLVWQPENI